MHSVPNVGPMVLIWNNRGPGRGRYILIFEDRLKKKKRQIQSSGMTIAFRRFAPVGDSKTLIMRLCISISPRYKACFSSGLQYVYQFLQYTKLAILRACQLLAAKLWGSWVCLIMKVSTSISVR